MSPKNGAAFDACTGAKANLLLAARYKLTETNYFVLKKVECQVKGYLSIPVRACVKQSHELFSNLNSVQNILNRKMSLKTPGLGCCLFYYKEGKSSLNRVTQRALKLITSHGLSSRVEALTLTLVSN